MNPAIVLILLGGAVAVAVAASSGGASSDSSSSSSLVQDSKDMVDIFQFYSKKAVELTASEVEQLGKLNAEAKGVPYKTIYQAITEWASNPGDKSQADIMNAYKQIYYLPPGIPTDIGPDLFTEWADAPTGVNGAFSWITQHGPSLVCSQYGAGGIGSPPICLKGIFYDFFGRPIGTYAGDNTVRGESDLMVIGQGFYKNLKDMWKAAGSQLLQTVANVASNYPGIGTAIAAGATFLEQVGSGASLENASLAAGRSAVPSALRSAYDVGVGIATQGKIDVDAALDVAMAVAISQGVVTGDILERYNSIKQAYDDAKDAGVSAKEGINTLGTSVNVATAH